MSSILVYCRNITSRLEYTGRFIFREILGSEIHFTNELSAALNSQFVINYSEEEIKSVFQIFPSGLLEEQGFSGKKIETIRENDIPCLFPVKGEDLPFDIFSSVFYMISRYEEYLPHETDQYGRYISSESLAWKENFLQIPVVDIWIRMLADRLCAYYSGLNFREKTSSFRPTIDIDNPWAFLNKSFYRKLGGFTKDIVNLNFNRLEERLTVLRSYQKDPYDSYEYIKESHSPELIIFFLLGSRSRHDNKISISNPAWNAVVKELSGIFTPGLHPSYRSNKAKSNLQREKQELENITGTKIFRSRQHFLKLEFPGTYRSLIKVGIKEDYSMGYSENTGFRAGTSYPFAFYDLENEEETDLRIFPFQVMDRTLKDYLGLNSEESRLRIKALVEQIRKFGGNFIAVWHNESLGTSQEWKGWKEVYEYLLQKGQELN